jgi:VIT1/CCC1 family predicted Fe2+/Mn2+ transporter
VGLFKEIKMKSKIIQTVVECLLAIIIFGGIGVLLAWRG